MKRTAVLMFILLSIHISICVTPPVKNAINISMHLAAFVAGASTWYLKYNGKESLSKNYLGGVLITYSILNLLEKYFPEEKKAEQSAPVANTIKKNVDEINPRVTAT
jgi:hypothetical protein